MTQAKGLFVGLTESRYKDKIVFTGASASSVSEVKQVAPEIARLRATFDSDKTRSKAWRVSQLKAIIKLFEEEGDLIREAMYKDLHKSPIECNLTEIDLVVQEAQYCLAHLDEWMSHHYVSISPLCQPGAGAVVYDPLGVVYIGSAWNYPVQLAMHPLCGAVAGGNCVVIKPGSYAPHTSHALADAIHKHMDRDAILVCEGDRHVTDAILKQRLDKILFTGSGFVGRVVALAAADQLCPVVLELGGKSPCIVDKSADLDLAASRLIWGAFLNSGQTCIRPDHVLVHADVADEFIAICKAKILEYYSEDPQKTEYFGRIINKTAVERLAGILASSKKNIVHGGKVDIADKFVEPTLLDYGTDMAAFEAAPAMQDEIFGPLLPMARFTDFERDVIQRVRKLPTGKPLALYVFANDAAVIEACTSRLTSGGMCVNDTLMHLTNHSLPFGGVGASGMGSYHGFRSFKTFTHEKALLIKYAAIDSLPGVKQTLAARFPPYVSWKRATLGLVSNPTLLAVMDHLDNPQAKQLLILGLVLLFKSFFKLRIAKVDGEGKLESILF